MKRIAIFPLALLLAAAPSARAFKSELKNADADFSYSWPQEVSAIPVLAKRFAADLQKQKAATVAGGKEYNAERAKRGEEPVGYMHSTEITAAGQSPRLLSLQVEVGGFTGGAHGNHGTDSLLWERRLGREIKVGDLFLRRTALANLTRPAFCEALDKERLKRRGGEKLGGQFDECPRFDELAILPVDAKGNGRFELIRFIASPYVAGPWVEGDYELELPVTSQLIRAIKPLYRASFEPQRQ